MFTRLSPACIIDALAVFCKAMLQAFEATPDINYDRVFTYILNLAGSSWTL